MSDINKPKHYTQGSIECIDAIDAMLEECGSSKVDFYRSQIVKYIWRMPHKGNPRKAGDADNVPLSFGQDAGLIKDIATVKDIVRQIVEEAENIISNKLPSLME